MAIDGGDNGRTVYVFKLTGVAVVLSGLTILAMGKKNVRERLGYRGLWFNWVGVFEFVCGLWLGL